MELPKLIILCSDIDAYGQLLSSVKRKLNSTYDVEVVTACEDLLGNRSVKQFKVAVLVKTAGLDVFHCGRKLSDKNPTAKVIYFGQYSAMEADNELKIVQESAIIGNNLENLLDAISN